MYLYILYCILYCRCLSYAMLCILCSITKSLLLCNNFLVIRYCKIFVD